MKTNRLDFHLTERDEIRSFALLIAGLNEAGVPYTVQQDALYISVIISTGF